ncbi:MAG TPA: hypothetical protein VFB54_12000 [Burkholderiales bacterium]|nr:hypothetical protein [Burkholderiales bacterium]
MANEVERPIWKAAVAATKRYFKGDWHSVYAQHYRTGYIMGYRAGLRLGKKRPAEPQSAEPR